jgi:uncharacterized protein
MRKIIFILVLVCFKTVFSQVPERPYPQKLYNNFSLEQPDFLTSQEAEQLETKLENFSNETSNQICVVITDELNGLTDEQYATEIGQKWGVGKKDLNNGIVILIKPTGKQGQRKLFIAIGYGLEGAIPDLATKKIREQFMYPYLKAKENYKALDLATTQLIGLAKGEINVKDYTNRRSKKSAVFWIIAIIIFIILNLKFKLFGVFGGHTFGIGGGGGGGRSSSGSSWGGFGGGSFGGGGSGGNW